MARIYYDPSGTILRVNRAPAMALGDPSTVQVLDIDERAHADVVEALIGEGFSAYKVVGGALRKDGAVVPLGADTPTRQSDLAFEALKVKVLAGTVLTLAEAQVVIRWLVRRELARMGGGE